MRVPLIRHLALRLGLLLVWMFLAPSALAADSTPGACKPRITSVIAFRYGPDAQLMSDWQPVTLPDNWSRRWPDYDGPVWYRIDWEQGCSSPAAPDRSASHRPVALTIDSICMAGEVFINRDLIWRDRHLREPLSRSWAMPRYWLLPSSSLSEDGTNTLWVRVTGVAAQNPGLGVVELGMPNEMLSLHEHNYWRSRTLTILNIAVSTMLGVMAFFIWLPNRKPNLFGWYALVSLMWVMFAAYALNTEAWPFSSTQAVARANNLFYIAFVACFTIFTWRLTDCPLSTRRENALWALSAGAAAIIVITPGWTWMQLAAHFFTLIFFANTVYLVWHARRTRNPEHMIVAACLLLMFLLGIRDTLVLHDVIHSRTFYSHYTGALFMLVAAIILRLRMLRDAQPIERFNQELTEAVSRACTDLSTTLEHEHSRNLANVQLQERLQLARDLHDGLGGQIVRSIMLVEQTDTPLSKQRFLSMLKLLRDDLRQVVDSGASIGTTVPATPLEWSAPLRHRFVSLFDELDITSRWHIPATWQTPPNALQCLLLARVIEEALTNIVKHSQASNVLVSLDSAAPARLILRIEDDGIGFDVQVIQRAGLGIGMSSMRARMERMGGTLQVSSRPGATTIQATLFLDSGLAPLADTPPA